MRSVAVLFVLGSHLYLYFFRNHFITRSQIKGMQLGMIGHWGVLIFFVHTCLVLMLSLERQHLRDPERPLFLPVLLQRVFRIFPLSVVVVLIVGGLGLPETITRGGQFIPVHPTPLQMVSSLLLIQNLVHTEAVTAPLWSLPYEMQMYLFLPALYLLVRAAKTAVAPLLLWAGAVLLAMHIYRMDVPPWNYTGMSPGLPDLLIYAPCFLAGVAGYRFAKGSRLNLPSFLWPMVLAGATALYLTRQSFRSGWFCCLVLGCSVPQFREISSPLLKKICLLIARYSYGIYLTHFVLIWLAFEKMSALPMWIRWAMFAVMATAIPVALYHGIEKPMIRLGKRIAESEDSLRSFAGRVFAQRKAAQGTAAGLNRLRLAPQLRAEEVLQDKQSVGGPLGEAAHEVGIPLAAERDVDAHVITLPD